jgi:hypothetical protein
MSRTTHSLHPWGEAATPYEEIGGAAVRALAEAFYDMIEEESPTLKALLPANTTNTRNKFFMHLTGWLGGPPVYEDKYGHPRLRMRHIPSPSATKRPPSGCVACVGPWTGPGSTNRSAPSSVTDSNRWPNTCGTSDPTP